MDTSGWIQLLLFVVGLVLITKPMGLYLLRVLDPEKEGGMGILERIFGPLERLIYRVAGIDSRKQQNWKQYAVALLIFSLVTTLASYGLYRIQDLLPLKANLASLGSTTDGTGALNGGGKVPAIIAFIQAVSFQTNTDWQSYEPEQMFTYFSQTVSTAVQFFFSSAIGIAVAAVLVRGVSRKLTSELGNFWVDLTRITLYLFLPICIVYGVFMVWQGTPMNFRPYTSATAVDQSAAAANTPVTQAIAQGPMASFCPPKVLGLNGPGFTGADNCHPFENPTPLSQFFQLMLFFSIIAGLPYYYGRMIGNTWHGWNIWAVMFILIMSGLLVTWYFETRPNPRLADLGIDPASANMEGKEVRIGIYNSAAWANDVTATAEGANNCQHDSMTPMAGFMLMFNMHLGEVAFGGIGSGLYGTLIFIFISVFLAGLMIGRSPEYLGKKIEGYDVKLASLFIFPTLIVSLAMTAWGCLAVWGAGNTGNGGPHGFSEIFYAYSSGVANNGTAFGGFTYSPTTTVNGVTVYASQMFNITQTFTMLFGRYFQIIPVLALAGALARKKPVAVSKVGSFPVTGPTFVALVVGCIVIVGALNFFPGLAMGPIIEHFQMHGTKILY
ncbi:MAG TPA: potassium-transporting ATPase subunit KdpA [Tepidisphaeraceae bacterium]|nr:potassium-transporting ATPase subunit KdpA [Tepidisphaeraceae bacterium]